MPSDSTPKHHSSPWYMLLNECKQQLTDNMFISPLWAQPANPPHNTAPAWVRGTAPLGHQSTNDEVRQEEMYYQESRKKSLDDYFSLRNVRTWQIAFETQQSMAAEITSKTKQTKLKALEKQLPFSSWVSWKRKQQRLTAAQPLKWWACLCFFIYTFMAVYCKIYKAEQFFFRGINHSSRRQKMAKWQKDNTLWYLFIFK